MATEGCMLVATLYSFTGSHTRGPLVVCHDGKALSTPFPPFPSLLHAGGGFVPGLIEKYTTTHSDDLDIECSGPRHTSASFLTVSGALELKSFLHQHIDVLPLSFRAPLKVTPAYFTESRPTFRFEMSKSRRQVG